MDTVFDTFTSSAYTFLKLDSGIGGNKILEEVEATGIVKLRDGMVQSDNVESYDSSSTVHIRASEPFIADLDGNLVGHGLRISKNGQTAEYRIEGQVEGYNFDNGTLEFLKVTLKRESIWDESDLPLE